MDYNATDQQMAWAAWYVSLGWQVFVLAADSSGGKVPSANCARCNPKSSAYEPHDMATCPCLLCHGFYAATTDLDRIGDMLRTLPTGFLAVRTGRASGVFVLDVESKDRGDLPTGLDIVDDWENLNGWPLPPTLTARSVSGGLHLYFRLPAEVTVCGTVVERNAVEVKGEGGYVGAPCGDDRRAWLDTSVPVAVAPGALIRLVTSPRSSRGGSGPGSAGNAGGEHGPLPPTEEFEARGLGWHTGSRNQDAYRLAWRLWAQDRDDREVELILHTCWEATADHTGSSWTELWRTAASARRSHTEVRAAETTAARAFLARWSA